MSADSLLLDAFSSTDILIDLGRMGQISDCACRELVRGLTHRFWLQ